MERRSYTRLTLALDIIGKIATGPYSGYHELSTVKHQIDLFDTIEIEPSDLLSIECNNPAVPCDERNICYRAAELLQRRFAIDQPVHIAIDKQIPVMGGLAGGSANAATTLSMLNDLWELHLDTLQLMEMGRVLGMDVPFYFIGKTAFDTEATGVCTELPSNIHLTFLLAIPDFGVATATAYQGIDYSQIGGNTGKTKALQQFLLAGDRPKVVSCIHNDFENSVFRNYPRLVSIKQELIDAGCETAVLSGSGSTIFGITRDREHASAIAEKIGYRTLIVSTLDD